MPNVLDITRATGIAGQLAYTARVQYDGEPVSTVAFVGSLYGSPGPITMLTESGMQTYVTDAGRFGPSLSPEWVRRFFA